MVQLRIKELCKKRGITLNVLAEKIGVSQPSISGIATGKQKPSLDTLERLAAALNVSIAELFEKPSDGNFICPNCGAEIMLEGKLVDGTDKMPDHENIRGVEYYK